MFCHLKDNVIGRSFPMNLLHLCHLLGGCAASVQGLSGQSPLTSDFAAAGTTECSKNKNKNKKEFH